MIFKNLKQRNNEKGIVLIVCLILLLMLSLIGIASITTSNSDMQVAGNEMNQTGAFYAAESGVEKSAAAIVTSYEANAAPPNPLPAGNVTQGNYRNIYLTADNGAAVVTTLTEGSYKGLYARVKSFSIASNGLDISSREAGVSLNMKMQDALIPIFQFAVFYDNDLEFSPGPNMTLSGRVHSNGDVYIQCSNRLDIDSYLTSAGNIKHGSKDGSGMGTLSGDVWIRDNNGTDRNMKNNNGTWLDSQNSDWVNSSISRWGGTVEDNNHGITELNMPVVRSGATTNLIDRASGNNDSFENKAGLKIIDNQVLYKQADGTWIDIRQPLIDQGVLSFGSFRDSRENKNVVSVDVNIAQLAASGYYPLNGIIYASMPGGTSTVNAFRVKNATTLPSALTFATNNPLYTVGNFNTNVKKAACLMADAITVLSANWNDANSWMGLNSRLATATQVNASYITGNMETGENGQAYSGGFENLLRFMEKWDGATFTWRGSGSNLWYSRQATGSWSSGYYFTPPTRDWAFDTTLANINNLPPGTPYINVVQRTQWSQAVYRP